MKPGDLVRKTAVVFKRTEMSLLPLDRAAAAVGLRASGARGVNAPRMKTKDAAALVLMVLAHTGGVSPEATAAQVRQVWTTKGSLAPLATWSAAASNKTNAIRYNKALGFVEKIEQTLSNFTEAKEEDCTFGECFTGIINDCVNGRMRSLLDKHGGTDGEKFSVKIEMPSLLASIEFTKIFDERDENGHQITLDVAYQFSSQTRNHNNSSEIITTRKMTVLPLLRIAEDFRD